MNRARGADGWSLFVAIALVLLSHQLWRLCALYLETELRPWGFAALAFGALVGFAVARLVDRFGKPEVRLPWLLVASAAGSIAASALPFFCFAAASWARIATLGSAAAGAMLTVATSIEAYRAVFRPVASHGFVERSLRPQKLLVAGVSFLGAFALAARVGLLRNGIAVAGALAAAAAIYPRVFASLENRRLPRAPSLLVTTGVAAMVVAAAFVVVDARVPANVLLAYRDEVVHATASASHDYAVVAAPGGFELYADGQLAVSSLDERRYSAALVRPALDVTAQPERVLVVFGGTGTIEREIVADDRIRSVTVLVADAKLLELARGMDWLRTRSRGALDERRVHTLTVEPMAWLAEGAEVFDVIVANLPAPIGYREGKYYTKYFLSLLAARLGEGGVLSIPAASALSAGDAFASVRRTVESAGLRTLAYHADVPTLGVQSFVLGSRNALPDALSTPGVAFDTGHDLGRESGLSYGGASVPLQGGLVRPPAAALTRTAPPAPAPRLASLGSVNRLEQSKYDAISTLHDQRVVTLFRAQWGP